MELRGDQARIREELYKVFPGIHFTIMSVVQGVAISQLAGSLTGILKNHAIGVEQKYSSPFYGLMSFGGMIVLTFEYSYYVALVRRPPLITDIAMPIILGTFQLWPLFFLDDAAMWWLLTGLFALAGVTAYINTLTKAIYEAHHRGRERQHKAIDFTGYKTCTWRHLSCTLMIAIVCISNAYLHYEHMDGLFTEAIALIVTTMIMMCMFYVSQLYLRPLYHALGMESAVSSPVCAGLGEAAHGGCSFVGRHTRRLTPIILLYARDPFR